MKSALKAWLLGYCVVATTVLVALGVSERARRTGDAAFAVVDVERINVREQDGTLRMVIASGDRLPGIIHKGVDRPHPGRTGAGAIFYNEEGTENGGLIFGGRRDASGKVVGSFGHLSFDQFEQDQVLALNQIEEEEGRRAGLTITDRPDRPMPFAELGTLATATAAEQEALRAKWDAEGSMAGPDRVYVGKMPDRSSALVLSDAAGRPRMRLEVKPDGASAIQFLDAAGRVVKTVGPDAGQSLQ